MAITNFIQTVWSEKLLSELGNKCVAAANSNREFEGEIKNVGDRVKICGVGPVRIFNYNKNVNMSEPETLDDTCSTLIINQAKGFNFQIDDVDLAQSSPKLMAAAMANAASALAADADKYIYSLYDQAAYTINKTLDDFDFFATLLEARTKIAELGGDVNAELVCEVTPRVAAEMSKHGVLTATDNTKILETGYIGTYCGCKIFISNNIWIEGTEHKCMVRTKRAIAYAEQLNEVDAYRPELRFADAVKGLHLYGAKVVYPNELIAISVDI